LPNLLLSFLGALTRLGLLIKNQNGDAFEVWLNTPNQTQTEHQAAAFLFAVWKLRSSYEQPLLEQLFRAAARGCFCLPIDEPSEP